MLVEKIVVWWFCVGKTDVVKKRERLELVQNG